MRKILAAILPLCLAVSHPASGKEQYQKVECPAGVDHSAWDRLLSRYVNDRGLVDYKAWKNNQADRAALTSYLQQFAPVATHPAQGNEKAASLVNAYNAIAIETILRSYPVDSIQQTHDPFTARRWDIGGANVSLDDIENGTLRPLLLYRAHSVLVCAARSCPPLQRSAYRGETFDQQDDTAYRAWLAREDMNRFLPSQNKAMLSSIFKWFKEDFEKSLPVWQVIAKYGPTSAQRLIAGGGKIEVGYLSYNWGLDDQGPHGRDYSTLNLIWDYVTH